MGQLDGKVAFITGIARGQGRSHAVTLAREGADIIGLDSCKQPATTPYPGATPDDLEETVRLVEETGHKIVAEQADVRDLAQVQAVFDAGIAQFGRVDIVLPNAGICAGGLTWEIDPEAWQEMLDVNLTGPWNTVRVALPTMIEQGDGGSIVFTGSVDALKGSANISSYAASKHGVTGLMRSLANEVGQYGIRVNSINPGHVDTDMLGNEFVWRLFRPDLETPTKDDVVDSFAGTNLLPIPWMQAAGHQQRHSLSRVGRGPVCDGDDAIAGFGIPGQVLTTSVPFQWRRCSALAIGGGVPASGSPRSPDRLTPASRQRFLASRVVHVEMSPTNPVGNRRREPPSMSPVRLPPPLFEEWEWQLSARCRGQAFLLDTVV